MSERIFLGGIDFFWGEAVAVDWLTLTSFAADFSTIMLDCLGLAWVDGQPQTRGMYTGRYWDFGLFIGFTTQSNGRENCEVIGSGAFADTMFSMLSSDDRFCQMFGDGLVNCSRLDLQCTVRVNDGEMGRPGFIYLMARAKDIAQQEAGGGGKLKNYSWIGLIDKGTGQQLELGKRVGSRCWRLYEKMGDWQRLELELKKPRSRDTLAAMLGGASRASVYASSYWDIKRRLGNVGLEFARGLAAGIEDALDNAVRVKVEKVDNRGYSEWLNNAVLPSLRKRAESHDASDNAIVLAFHNRLSEIIKR
jgi:hypothetical protein